MEGEHRGLSRRERRYVEEMSRPADERWLAAGCVLGPVVVLGMFGGVAAAGWVPRILVTTAFVLVFVIGLDVLRRWRAGRGLG
ncbi:hypothetical protein [Nocardioides zeae]|uniref:Uncharacterized protein n=1 Tax=Nocardioides zeae TaxID=1457234 RepID=A0AAJ1X420_9ACTN|nr:hypothetical protein [Nocardioides zeae]MDQ1106329.1 hypothetical protein [Nocardioides zeae]